MSPSFAWPKWIFVLALAAPAACAETASSPADADSPPASHSPPGAQPPPPASFASGSRFQARFLVAPQTAPLLIGVHDRQRRVDCLFAQEGDGAATCIPISRTALDPPTPADAVQGEIRVAMKTARLGVREISTSDGGRFPLFRSGRPDTIDTRWDAICSPDQVPAACLPAYALHLDAFAPFADDACSEPLGLGTAGRRPLLVLLRGVAHAIGEAWAKRAFALAAPAKCVPYPYPDFAASSGLWRIGAPLPEGSLAPLRPATAPGGRLALRVLQSEGETVMPAYEVRPPGPYSAAYVDREVGAECTPLRTTSGARCVSAAGFVRESQVLFLDSACTQAVANTLDTNLPKSPTTPWPRPAVMVLVRETGRDLLATATAARRVERWISNNDHPLYRKQSGGCALNPNTKVEYGVLAEAIDWQRFPPVEEWLGNERVAP